MIDADPHADALPGDWNELGMAELLPTGMVTLLLADVESSTRLWQTRPEEMAAAVRRLDEVLAALVTVHGGVRPVEQGEGDSFVVAFSRASDAVACVLDLQCAGLAPIRLRIGLHTGEVRLRDAGNYVGPTINRTARLRELAHGGQTVLSGVTAEIVVDSLPDGVWLTDLGTHRLRDLPRPERVVQLCHPELTNEFPPLRAPENGVIHHLPARLTSFVGRGRELAELRKLLGDNRLVTLTGAGGAGKTRLAVELTARVAAEFADGAWYVDLAPILERGMVSGTVARALGLPDQPGRPVIEAISAFAGGRQMLLVLDNCEHLLEASAALATELLSRCPELTLLTTSREPLGVPGELTYQVPSLSLDGEATELFSDRARRVRPGFTVSGENSSAVTEICRRLDCMPLAIELAAARVRALSAEEIVESLHDRFRLLTGGARTAVRRQQTLRASVDWSHALLTDAERAVFRRLAVFVGGFDLDAAQAVTGDTEVERYQVLDQLGLLVDKSLVVAENDCGTSRYRLLETMRQYALEKLSESGESVAVRDRHRDHFTRLAAMLDDRTYLARKRGRERIETDIDNVRAAFGWCLENGDAGAALRLASSLQAIWNTGGTGSGPWGRAAEGVAWFDAVLTNPDIDLAEVPADVMARALADSVQLFAAVGRDGDIDRVQRAVAIARESGDPGLLARALFACGSAYVDDSEQARAYFGEALELARTADDRWMVCGILAWTAYATFLEGRLLEAIQLAREGQELADSIGDRDTSRHCRWSRATATCHAADFGCLSELEEILHDARAADDVVRWANTLACQSHALVYRGEWQAARAAADALDRVAASVGPAHGILVCAYLACAALAAGDIASAVAAGGEGRRLLADTPVIAAVRTMNPAAETALAQGDLVTARRFAEEAVAGAPVCLRPRELNTRARVALAEGDATRALSDVLEASALAAENGLLLELPNTLELLAQVKLAAAVHHDAARLLGAADAVRSRHGLVRFAIHQDAHVAAVTDTRNGLGRSAFDNAWAEGAALSTAAAIELARPGRADRKRPASGWPALTPAEISVVRLVCEGLGNNDIAGRLFISHRTVQTHLTHIYAKLGYTSRVRLVNEAGRYLDLPVRPQP